MRHDKVALVDMDGTLADYDKVMIEIMKTIQGPNDPEFIPHTNLPHYIEERRQIISRLPGFWRELPKYEPGFDILKILIRIGFHVHIFTKGPNKKSLAWSEKVDWCEEHVAPLYNHEEKSSVWYNRGVGHDFDMSVTTFKGLTYGRVLVDDYPDYVLDWLENRPRGLVIMPQNEKNKSFKHPNVIHYTGENIGNIQSALEKSFNRE